MHLTYLGDARVGSGTNIGAGTITCNYDGVNKNPTTIGKGVFIGSDTALVAPVRIGDGAYVGAGSVITKNVPPDALGVARGQQVNKLGWAETRRREMAATAAREIREAARKQSAKHPAKSKADFGASTFSHRQSQKPLRLDKLLEKYCACHSEPRREPGYSSRLGTQLYQFTGAEMNVCPHRIATHFLGGN